MKLVLVKRRAFTINGNDGVCDRALLSPYLSLFLVQLQAFTITCCFASLIKLTHIKSVSMNFKKSILS